MNKNLNNDKKVELRPIRSSDAQFLMELNNNEEIAKYVVGTPTMEMLKILNEKKEQYDYTIGFNQNMKQLLSLSDDSYIVSGNDKKQFVQTLMELDQTLQYSIYRTSFLYGLRTGRQTRYGILWIHKQTACRRHDSDFQLWQLQARFYICR